MNVAAFSSRPGILVHLVALTAAVLGVSWAWSGMSASGSKHRHLPTMHRSYDVQDTVRAPASHIWTTGDIGKMVAMSGLSVEALSMSSDEEQVVVQTLGSYDDLYTLTGKLSQTSGLCVNSLSLRKSRRASLIEATLLLRIAKSNDQ